MRYSRGFSLVELMVSIGLFAFVSSIATGAYLVMLSVNREAQANATGINNVSFALENMVRTIRTGRNYYCEGTGNSVGTNDCSAGASIQVTNPDRSRTVYSLEEVGQKGRILIDGETLTDPLVDIDKLEFYVSGTDNLSDTGDILQPYVTIVVSGTVSAGVGKDRPFYIQTGAVMRGIDL